MKALFNAHAGARLQYSYIVCLSVTALAVTDTRPYSTPPTKVPRARRKDQNKYGIELKFLS